MAYKRKSVLFVDDDAQLLDLVRQLMGRYAGDAWEIFTAPSVGEALAAMQQQRIDLLVLDVHMPVVDGLQFLNLLKRKYPNVLKVVLTGDASEKQRAACLNNGAELFLEKPADEKGWKGIYSTLDELAKFQPEEGFRGVLRRVGLQDVLQMECLGRNSVILSIRAGEMHGQVFVKDGEIIHAQSGGKSGVEAFNELLGLKGGEFDLQPFLEPPARTIEGQWEFLLMEAARKRDETSRPEAVPPAADVTLNFSDIPDMFGTGKPSPARPPTVEAKPAIDLNAFVPPEVFRPARVEEPTASPRATSAATESVATHIEDPGRPQVEELLVCSLQGDVLHEWQSPNANGRVGFLEFLSQKTRQLAQGLPLGEFDRLEVNGQPERVIARLQPEWALFARVRRGAAGTSSAG